MESISKDICWTKDDQLALIETRPEDSQEPNQIRIWRWDRSQCECITSGMKKKSLTFFL